MATDRFGIDDSYHDARGVQARYVARNAGRAAGRHGRRAPKTAAPALDEPDAVRVLLPGGDRRAGRRGGADLVLEDGTSRPLDGELCRDELPFGYHRLIRAAAARRCWSSARAAAHLPDDLRAWGFAAQLYAARSRASWGIGDLADLARLGRWTRSLGGGVLMVNPLTAPTPVPPIEPSPYYPSSRRYRNPLFLRIEELPGWDGPAGATCARA